MITHSKNANYFFFLTIPHVSRTITHVTQTIQHDKLVKSNVVTTVFFPAINGIYSIISLWLVGPFYIKFSVRCKTSFYISL